MGAGKEAPPSKDGGGDGGTAAAPEPVVLGMVLHCNGCAKKVVKSIKHMPGVASVTADAASNRVVVAGTADAAAIRDRIESRTRKPVEILPPAAPGKKDDGGGDTKKDKGGDGHMTKDKSAAAAGDVVHKDKGKGIEVAGPSMASAAASMAPASAMANTHHVSPYGYAPVAYPQPPQGPPPGYYNGYYGGGNADGAGYATPYYQQQPRAEPGSYYNPHPSADAGSYYNPHPSADANGGSYYQHPGGYGQDQHPNPQSYPAYPFDTAPPPQMFSDENPNSCSVM